MKMGFIGIGQVGSTLAKRFGSKGHSIYLGVRDLNKKDSHQIAQSIGANAEVLSILETIEKSEIVFLATPFNAVEGFLKEYSNALTGKILVDCTNPLKPDLSGLLFTGEDSGGEYVQRLLPQTKVVKAFNTVGYNIMENPVIDGRKSVMYFCGNDEKAKHVISSMITEIDFMPIDSGPIQSSRSLEPFALLWISTAYKYGIGRDFAFSLNRRN